ncbi:MAG: hypothetical protein AB8B96_14445 [Lysobacterales bacterium]
MTQQTATPWLDRLCLLLIASLVLMVQLRGFSFAGAGLDPSWMRALENAALLDWQWGRDIVFTFGPLGYLSPGLFHPDTAVWILLWQLLLAGAWLVFFSAQAPLRGVVLLLLAMPVALIGVDHLALAVPFAAALLAQQGHRRRALLLFLLAGFAANVKFSSLIAAVAMAGLVDLIHLRQVLRLQKVPGLALVGLGFVVGYLLGGQSLAYLPTHLLTSLTMASGYSDAMVQYGAPADMLVFAALAAGFAGIAWACGQPVRRNGTLLLWLVMVFLLFKFGYVRHSEPRHFQSLAGLVSLAMLMLVATGAGVEKRISSGQPQKTADVVPNTSLGFWAVSTLAVGVFAGVLLTLAASPHQETNNEKLSAAVQRLENRWNTIAALTHMTQWHALARRRQRTDAQVADQWDENPESSIDTLGWAAATAMASGARYRPRPVFQSYAAYSPELAQINRSAWEAQLPQRVLFHGTGIDRWWPGLADGELHMLAQKHYRVSGNKDRLVQLERVQGLNCNESRGEPQGSVLGQWTTLTSADAGVVRYLRFDLKRSLAGHVRKTFYKSRLPQLEVRLADGSSVTHTVPISFSGVWFPLSPIIRKGDERLLFQPALAPADAQVTEFRLTMEEGVVGGLAQQFSWESLDLSCESDEKDWINELISGALYNHKMGPKFERGALSAHAPMLFQLPVQSISRVRLVFGIRNGAWKQGDTDGVRFDIVFQGRDGVDRLLSTRTLKPKVKPADRNDQEMVVQLPSPQSGTLMIGILPLENTGWDWSYVRTLELE